MATKRSAKQTNGFRILSEKDVITWIRAKVGDTKHEAFALEIGVSRQILSSVLLGKRRPGVFFLRKMKRFGMEGARKVYVVSEASCEAGVPAGVPADVLS